MKEFEEAKVKETSNAAADNKIESTSEGFQMAPPDFDLEVNSAEPILFGEVADNSSERNKYSEFHKVAGHIKLKLEAAHQLLLVKRAEIRRINFEAGSASISQVVTQNLDKFLSKSDELLKVRELNEKNIDSEAKEDTDKLRAVQKMATKITHGVALLGSVLHSSGDQINDTIDRFENFLTFTSDFIPDVPIISNYLKFVFDGGKVILGAIKKIKANIADMNAISRHSDGSDYKMWSKIDGTQAMMDYLNNYAFKAQSYKELAPVPEKVKEYVYENEARLQLDINKYTDDIPADDSYLTWSTYDEGKLRKWIFEHKDAVYEKLTGFQK